jgi:hypothetical protein
VERRQRVEAEGEQLQRQEDRQQLGAAQHQQQAGRAPEQKRMVLAGKDALAPQITLRSEQTKAGC